MSYQLSDTRVGRGRPLLPPIKIIEEFPASARSQQTVWESRQEAEAILAGELRKKILIIGPCSIHDVEEAREYARLVAGLRAKVGDRILVMMRTYLEKPRSGHDWEGYMIDPDLDFSYQRERGRRESRNLLADITDMGVPTVTEMVDTSNPQFIDDLVTIAMIGARTVSSPTHRSLASGLSMPVGFKNPLDGRVAIAVDALEAARNPNSLTGLDKYQGTEVLIPTYGNKTGFIVLRGGHEPNHEEEKVREVQELLAARNAKRKIDDKIYRTLAIDCSHGNSRKKFEYQPMVFLDVARQSMTNPDIVCIMLESYLKEGSQKIPEDHSRIIRGISVTDGCVNWRTTENLAIAWHSMLRP